MPPNIIEEWKGTKTLKDTKLFEKKEVFQFYNIEIESYMFFHNLNLNPKSWYLWDFILFRCKPQAIDN